MNKVIFPLLFTLIALFIVTTSGFASEAVYYPKSGIVNIPQLVVDGDPSQTVYAADLQQRNGSLVFDVLSISYALTAPNMFTEEWLAGKTLYRVWHGNGNLNGVILESVPVVVELYFSPNGIVIIQGMFNNDINSVAAYTVGVNNGRLFIADNDANRYHEIVCGSTDRYVKTYSFANEGFENVNLFFFDRNDALSAAEFLSNDPPMCPTAP